MNKAIFLDRDGVINELVYYPDHGIVDSPFSVDHLRIYPWASEAICKLREMGFKVILVSNQPGVAKGFFPYGTFEEIRKTIIDRLTQDGATLDGEYYCMHHPNATVDELRINCSCRKPEPGLLLQAAEDMNIDLASSWMIGDGLTDVKAGKTAGCKTILIGKMKCELCNLMDEMDARSDIIASNLLGATELIQYHE
ncbi:MAG: HAD family hydrolase [Chloroflexi bacterium]|nr:HAD family hydrolase [Chloroflexota bacterium]